jgi:hypothetical protein
MRRLRRPTSEKMSTRRREVEESLRRSKSPLDVQRRDKTDKARPPQPPQTSLLTIPSSDTGPLDTPANG